MVPPLARIEADSNGPVPVVRISGELDMDNARQISESLLELVPREAPGLVADLSELAYLDSAGVRVFVEVADRLRANRQVLELIVPDAAPISRVLSLVKLELVIPIHRDRDTALAAVTAIDR